MFISYFILLAFGFLTGKEYTTFINVPKNLKFSSKQDIKVKDYVVGKLSVKK